MTARQFIFEQIQIVDDLSHLAHLNADCLLLTWPTDAPYCTVKEDL